MANTNQDGVTKSERHLSRLCRKSFLRLWSYPNVYRHQKKHSETDDGKELCDLLVVCGNDVIIFSDKCCEFPDSGDLKVDWVRWFKKAVFNSAKQVYGAERWIRQHSDKLYLDRACTQRLPLSIPGSSNIRVHRIIVASGAKDRCKREMNGGSGSLMIMPEINGATSMNPKVDMFEPFAIGRVNPNKGFIHVLDEVALDIVMKELDTITDFIDYLGEKEALIESERLYFAAGEEELLAVYLTNVDDKGKHCFPVPDDCVAYSVGEGLWHKFTTSLQYRRKEDANEVSYLWDNIIEDTAKHAINGTLVHGNELSLSLHEKALRVMARENRFSRRVLSRSIWEYIPTIPAGQSGRRAIVSKDQLDTLYVFVATPKSNLPYGTYRERRRIYLDDCCTVVASKHRKFKRVVGIATESESTNGYSHDLCYFEPDEWTPEQEAEVERIIESTGIGTCEQEAHVHEDEYPEISEWIPSVTPPAPKGRKIGRNDPCPCGSGKKYKKCCLR